jgi:predicted metalloprotease with PDZ domain
VIVRISAGSPAARAGLALGDRIAAIDGKDLISQADMVARLAAAGNRVAVDVDRKGRIVRLEMNAVEQTGMKP